MAKPTKHGLFDSTSSTSDQIPVECLGMTFPNKRLGVSISWKG